MVFIPNEKWCRCDTDCANTFRLRYKGQYATISPSMTEEEVADGIMAMSTVKVLPTTNILVLLLSRIMYYVSTVGANRGSAPFAPQPVVMATHTAS